MDKQVAGGAMNSCNEQDQAGAEGLEVLTDGCVSPSASEQCPSSPKPARQDDQNGMENQRLDFHTASKKDVTVSSDAWQRAQKSWEATESVDDIPTVAVQSHGFTQALGRKSLAASRIALTKAQQMWANTASQDDSDALENLRLAGDAQRRQRAEAEAANREAEPTTQSDSSSTTAGQDVAIGVKRPNPSVESTRNVKFKCDEGDNPTSVLSTENQPLMGIPALGTPSLRSGGVRRVGLSRLTPRNAFSASKVTAGDRKEDLGASPTLRSATTSARSGIKPFKPPTKSRVNKLAAENVDSAVKNKGSQEAGKSDVNEDGESVLDSFDVLIMNGAFDDHIK